MAGSLNAVDAFMRNLETSNLLTGEQLDAVRSEFRTIGVAELQTSVEGLAERGWLTHWQAQMLLAGRIAFFLGKYKLLDHLGEGGMGSVLKAEQLPLGRLVAIKTLRKELLSSPAMVSRFHREIHAAAALSHPNIVSAYDADCIAGRNYLVMEYVVGEDLSKVVSGGKRLPIGEACEYIRQAARGLGHAHERGMVHRDIKPSNLLLARQADGSPAVKILDMGLAVLETAAMAVGDLTLTGEVVGTPDYIAPEQARKMKSADIRSDIYSLGCTLFRLLTGKPPFDGESVIEKITARLVEDPPPLRSALPDAPEELEVVLLKMMERDPDARYQLPGEVSLALSPFAAILETAAERLGSESAEETKTEVDRKQVADSELAEFLSQLSTEAVRRQEPDTGLRSLEKTPADSKNRTLNSASESDGAVTPVETAVMRSASSALNEPGLSRAGRFLHKEVAERGRGDRRRLLVVGTAIGSFLIILMGLLAWRSIRETRLVIEWPADERDGATIEVDGRIRQLEAEARIEFTGPPGLRTLRMTRDGYQAIEQEWEIESGQEFVFRPRWKQTTETSRKKELKDLLNRVAEWRNRNESHNPEVVANDPTVSRLRTEFLDFRLRHPATGEALQAGSKMSVLAWPIDGLRRSEIDPDDLRAAMLEETSNAPEKLVAVYHHETLDEWIVEPNSVEMSRDGLHLLSAGGSAGTVKLWRVDSARQVRAFPGGQRAKWPTALSRSGKKLAIVSRVDVSLFKDSPWTQQTTLVGASTTIDCVAISPNDKLVAAGTYDGNIHLWDTLTGKQRPLLTGHVGRVYHVAFHPDGKSLASVGADKSIKLWDLKKGKVRHSIDGHTRRVFGVAFSPDGSQLASAGEDTKVKLWDAVSGREMASLEGHVGKVYSVAFRADGRRLVSAGRDDGTVRIWGLTDRTGFELETIRLGSVGNFINSACFAPDGRHVVTANGNGTVYVLRLQEWEPDMEE